MLPLVNLLQRRRLVCSADPAVTLAFVPQTEDECKAGTPSVRKSRKPVRWLPCDDLPSDEVETVISSDALIVTVRPLNRDEQFQVTGGLSGLGRDGGIGRSNHLAPKIAVQNISGPGVAAHTPPEIEAVLNRLPLRYADSLGDRIVDDSCGFNDPFASSV